jgi:membrane-associated phospholipid phosphatase
MYTKTGIVLILTGAIASALLCVAAARNPYFPTDVPIARAVQAVLPGPARWASWITWTADKPACFVLLALTIIFAWAISGWRAALLTVPIFFGLWGFGAWLSPLAAQPRPSPELIRVVGHPKGYAFPSIFGLIYVATFGYVGALGAVRLRGAWRAAVPILAAAALLAGAAARLVLGAHWPSDLWVAYLIGFVWIAALTPLSRADAR